MKILCNRKNYAMRVDWVQSKACFGNFGVFGRHNILKGEVIEECPTAIREYYDEQEDHFSYVIYENGQQYVFTAFGLGSLYNHRNIPNAHWYFDTNEKLLTVYALEDIGRDEEICINYRIEKNYRTGEFDLRQALAEVPLEEYKKLTFEVDVSDIVEYIKRTPHKTEAALQVRQ